ncbi:hypothetical protein HO133_007820 [Letharia lupina]|uniref:DUF6590 domain-containing protein n=1 Tax=Letharia lupina TaxID=560253 RepID=A0A8H6CR86_9LECA|nr:uncharacterized protein HO133_007820 [Letharia lupina]KAF6228092.1 hypothetical protein HO133_007820 [Letharia lupina]
MSPGFQKPGTPSFASSLRGEPPPYKPSRAGRPAGNPPPSAFQNKNYNKASLASNAGNHLPSTPSNLGPYSHAHTRTQKSVVADTRIPKKSFFDDDSATTSQATCHAEQTVTEGATVNSKPKSVDPQGVVESMTKLSVDSTQKSGSVIIGRCLNWERPNSTSSTNSKVSKCLPRSDRSYLKPASSEYSISYKRTPNQPPMEQAGFREYAPFLKSEFKIGTIVRRNVHEPDYMGPAVQAFAPGSQASQTSTLVGKGARGSREHRSTGDFGPIYSEDRYFIVVSLCKMTYYAIPLYTHEKKGLANIAEKEDWVSVQDHRNPDSCRQQSEHLPLRTTIMAPEAKILNPVSAAWLPYAIPIRYSVPVAYQGRLDQASAKRVRTLFLEHLGGEK